MSAQTSTSKVCPSGYSKKGDFCYRHTVATPYCTSSAAALDSNRGTCTTTSRTNPTCAKGSLSGNRCTDTALTDPDCDSGETLQGNYCVKTTYTDPDCDSGETLQGDYCIKTTYTDPECKIGDESAGKCVHTRPPSSVTYTCADNSTPNTDNECTTKTRPAYTCNEGSTRSGTKCKTRPAYTCDEDSRLSGTKCIHRQRVTYTCDDETPPNADNKCVTTTTDRKPHTTTTKHDPHNCPAGYQNLSLPLPLIYFVYTSATPEVMTHEQLNEFYKSGKVASANPGEWEQLDNNHDCYKAIEDKGTTGNILNVFIDIGETISDGLKTAYDATMKAICTETGQFLTENLVTLGATVFTGGNAYVAIGTSYIIDKALEYQCSRRRSNYGTHQDAILKSGCTSDGKFTASNVTGMSINYVSNSPYKTLYELAGSLFLGEFLEKACDALSTNPDATPTPPPPFRTPTPTPTPNPDDTSGDSKHDTVSNPPGPASDLLLTAGDKQIKVSWTASSDTPAAEFGYQVQWKQASQTWDQAEAAAQYKDLEYGSDLATSHTITGLSNGSPYEVRVAAFNAGGFSNWIDGTASPAKPTPTATPTPTPRASLVFESVSCSRTSSAWVISVSWAKSPANLPVQVWVTEIKSGGHHENRPEAAGASAEFEVPSAGWYDIGTQAKPKGEKNKIGDTEVERCS
ncbi:fibronectin type III domain-containing protein [Candidatus Poriferisocius sp.]|uniref:fibronectin type III domain-containing protein n=1 Tax=Candidatus Poriferisocius sp. TaxID=3101276 RepID=UPI003B52EC17